ncbi:PAS domain-containing sensor histidine kinase [Sphingomonas sp. S2-65]|uniref:hybrid sensor histidine kinase/response regulator n=1 Tax=Sphingomonas sp. S2-65 TaxID=2903960 RepID=UPI001F1F0769|nr:PAS domain-containing sensor histidine kinase [Sphingomonas sp. S2-65]UYY58575.1 PAS domain S-box protein [Sphingomonas sp. S2-65]
MGTLIQDHAWQSTPLGPIEAWPEQLRAMAGMILCANQPMFVVWGPERTLLYNDAYAEILKAKHPAALGRDFLDAWAEIRGDLAPIVAEAYAGNAVYMRDILLMMERRGAVEEAHFTFSYTPLHSVAGVVRGFLCACIETTGEVEAESLRQQREERLRLILDSATDYAILTSDADRRITSWSKGAEIAFGWREQDAIGRLTDDLYLPEDRAAGAPAQEQQEPQQTGFAPNIRWHQRADGSRVFMNGSVHPLGTGGDGGLLKIARNETEQRRHADELARTRAELVTSEERFRALIAASTAAVWTTDPTGNVIEDSPSWRAFTGQTVDEWMGIGWLDAVHPADRERATGKWQESVAHGTEFATEFRLRHAASDSWRWTRVRAVPLRNKADEIVEWVGMNVDIDEQKHAEMAVAESEARFRNMADHAPVMMWVTDPSGYCTYLNRAWYEFTGQSEEEAQGYGWLDATHPEDEPAAEKMFVDSNAVRSRFRVEYRLRQHDGTYRWAIDAAAPRFGEDGAYLGYVGSVIDITERREAEERLQQLNHWLEERVHARTAELVQAQDALRQSQKMEAIGQLTGGVAHDFNNLLTVIRSSADLLRRDNVAEVKKKRYIDAIADTADRAAKLTGQLLAFSRRQALKAEVFDVPERLRIIGDMLGTAVGPRITLNVLPFCDPCFVDADPGQFETSIVNLAVNARDAMNGEGVLTIRVEVADALPTVRGQAGAKGPFVAISVEDQGPGIAPEIIDRIFEPFFTTKGVGRGTGLGLSQVYGFTKQSGGEITVHSEPGQPTVFTMYLPKTEAPAEAVDQQPAGETPDGGGHILLVEDNVQVGEFATHLLRDLGYQVTHAVNADAAIACLEQPQAIAFDLVFSDVIMPGRSGLELAREIQTRWPELPVVLTSGYSHVLAEDARHGFPLLQKPYSAEDLARMLRQVLARSRQLNAQD